MARDWLARYGGMTPKEYRSATWLEAWTPRDLPPAPPAGRFGVVVSLGLAALLVVGAWNGNSLLLFLLLLFAAVVLHEAGHWFAARRVGIPILVFTVGAGPVVRSCAVRSGRLPMRIDLKLLPLLGHVRPYTVPAGVFRHWEACDRHESRGEAPPPVPEFDTDEEGEPAFLHVSRLRRLVYLTGGLAVNLVAAVAFLWTWETMSDEAALWTAPVAGLVPPGSVADRAGIREGDRFVSADGEPVRGFFDVQRRLAPLDRAGGAAPPADPPGRTVPLVIRRDGTELQIGWTTPLAPPEGDPTEAYGLLPPETWRIARVQEHVPRRLRPGAEVRAFRLGGAVTQAGEPGAHGILHAAFANAERRPVEILLADDPHEITVAPWAPDLDGRSARRAPFTFERLREPGPRDGLPEVVATVVGHGWRTLVELPRDVVASLHAPPTAEEKGWLLEAVRRDPWHAARTFALIHAVLLFLNLVPIPPLDGFQILCTFIEAAVRRPIPRRGLGIAMRIGWGILLLWLAVNAFLIVRDLAGSVV